MVHNFYHLIGPYDTLTILFTIQPILILKNVFLKHFCHYFGRTSSKMRNTKMFTILIFFYWHNCKYSKPKFYSVTMIKSYLTWQIITYCLLSILNTVLNNLFNSINWYSKLITIFISILMLIRLFYQITKKIPYNKTQT